MGLGTIFNHVKFVSTSKIADRLHSTWPTREMYNQDRFGTWTQYSLDRIARQCLAVGIDVSNYRTRPAKGNTTCRGDERSGRYDNFISRLDSKAVKCRFKSDASIGQGDCVRRLA